MSSSKTFGNPFELFCESSIGSRTEKNYEAPSDAEFVNLIGESAMASAHLIAEANTAGLKAAMKCSAYTGDKESAEYAELICESSNGIVSSVWASIKKVFEAIVNFIKGIIGKFASGDGSKITEEVAALKAKLEALGEYVNVPETSRIELQKHEPAAAISVAAQILDTENYLGLKATGDRDEKAPVAIEASTSNTAIGGITKTIMDIADMDKAGTGDESKVEAASKALDGWKHSFDAGNTGANQERIVGAIIKLKMGTIKSSVGEGNVDFTAYKYGSNRDGGKGLQEAIQTTFFDKETKTYKGNDILDWVSRTKTTVSSLDVTKIRTVLVKGEKDFADILDGWKKLEGKMTDRKNEKGEDGNETNRAKLASKIANNMNEYSKVVALLNGALLKGFTTGNDLAYKAVQSLKNQVTMVDKIVVEKGSKKAGN